MPTPVYMPKFEMTQETGQVVAWLKKEGDQVEKGEPLLQVETDKAILDVEAPATGTLAAISAQRGQVVPIGTAIAYILKPGESLGSSSQAETVAGPSLPEPHRAGAPALAPDDRRQARPTPLAARLAASEGVDLQGIAGTGPGGRISRADVETAMAAAAEGHDGSVRAVPAARRLARELGIDLRAVRGSGPDGRIQSADVARALTAQRLDQAPVAPAQPTAAAPAAGGIPVRRAVPLTNIRRVIVERMTASVREAPQFTVTVDADMERALGVVADLKAAAGDGSPKVTLTALLVKACAWALRRHPEANASFQGDGIVEWGEVNVGVATAVDQGLIVPVLHRADQLGLRGIAAQLAELTARAREGKARLDDLQGGTFTVSNLGMFGIDRFTAILNPPQAAILAVGRVAKRAEVMDGDRVEIRPMAALALTADHRVLDGATAARFLATVQRALEHPGVLLE
ncbi:MAG TPA: 2-oxo acid dehydrogenase subunit E2 [Anaerolineae bacterium]|nr:2-oxo acid dehydrogenase subunit E2 [Anaerolineae bacterium]HOQ97948.1 2-oxo acid dehydrogenase subunit E2 [Anaerolineae bacterium]HPL29917.1 2-oxo acid dehydrogenase subunit E2 [Anaerolineae bacterium]